MGGLENLLDALSQNVAILDERARIVAVNAAWKRFAEDNAADIERAGIGVDYLAVCESAVGPGSDEASAVAEAIRDVIAGRRDEYHCEYPCHGPHQQRWFTLHITRFSSQDRLRLAVVHDDISRRKRAESRLELMAMTDALTGIHNRRYLFERGEEEVWRSLRYGEPLSLLMLDVDALKKINDDFGHDFGDAVLKELAATLRRSLREVDIVGRVGGEEFVAVLPSTALGSARLLAERLLGDVREMTCGGSGIACGITASIGVATLTDGMETFEALLKAADVALYRAKAAGRDRCRAVEPEVAQRGTPSRG